MTTEERCEWYADSLRNKYNRILEEKGCLSEEDYKNMIQDADCCTKKEPSSRGMILDVLEEFDRRKRQ